MPSKKLKFMFYSLEPCNWHCNVKDPAKPLQAFYIKIRYLSKGTERKKTILYIKHSKGIDAWWSDIFWHTKTNFMKTFFSICQGNLNSIVWNIEFMAFEVKISCEWYFGVTKNIGDDTWLNLIWIYYLEPSTCCLLLKVFNMSRFILGIWNDDGFQWIWFWCFCLNKLKLEYIYINPS